MTLTVEAGTGNMDADSYVTLADYQAYGAAIGWTLGADDAADEINLRRAFQTINRKWRYMGIAKSDVQAGAFPRSLWDGIPQAIKDAQCELAYLIQGGADPYRTVGATTAETVTVGPITLSSDTTPSGGAVLAEVAALLSPYIGHGAGQVRMVRG